MTEIERLRAALAWNADGDGLLGDEARDALREAKS